MIFGFIFDTLIYKTHCMSVSYIKLETRFILWGKSAGRCQYDGCNKLLFRESLTKAEFNTSYVAHIIADKATGPRGDKVLSEKLKSDITNLMLLCDEHHRLIDIKQVNKHSVKLLQEMKKRHEERTERLTNIQEQKQAHIILYGANIGSHSSLVVYKDAITALAPRFYPSDIGGIELGMVNSSFTDRDSLFWKLENENLLNKFNQKVVPIKESNSDQKYCVFGVAPQPLLIKLGTLLYDLADVNVFSNQKEPKTWKWKKGEGKEDYFKLIEPKKVTKKIALIFSLSATINDDRITKVLGKDSSIWKITIDEPNNDFMKYENHLSQFRSICRYTLNKIKSVHGENFSINVFPAMLPSTAIEFGRIWYPKADLPLNLYDQNRDLGGFIKTIEIKN